jgi:predicted nucleic acid-binding protein
VTTHPSLQSSSPAGFYDGFECYKTYSDEELREALRSSLVVLDTNVLLNLYRYNDETRASIIDVMRALGSRLWIPHQVLEEFWRNRERALTDPLAQVRQSSAELERLQNAAQDTLRVWVNRAALTAQAAALAEAKLAEAFEEAQSLLDELLDEAQIQQARSTQRDPVLALLEPVLNGRVGPPMSEDSHAKAVLEGQRRAAAGEPPGFRDASKSDKGPEGAAGDYLVWEQVLVEATARGLPVVFVTGDVKRDWWRFEGSNARGPRIELAREMKRRCDAHLYMLRPDALLSLADALAVSVRPRSVEDVERTTRVEDAAVPVDDASSGWTRDALETLLRGLASQAPVQEATIRLACQQDGFVSRDDVYRIGEYDASRQLKGFTRPVNRLVQQLRDSGDIPEEAADVLVPVYDEMKHGFGWADGFRVPSELVALLRD